jgi:hypothetical protein
VFGNYESKTTGKIMKLVIIDPYGEEKVIENPQFIPTEGSRIAWRYTPAPRVVEIVYDYDGGMVYIKIV